MQFGINKHQQIFLRLQKIARARRASAICSLWKVCECLFIPNCTRKIIWLLVNNIQVTIFVTLQYFTWQMEATSCFNFTGWKFDMEFKRKNSFSLSKSCMKTEQFLLTVKSSIYPQLNIEELDHKAKEKLISQRIRCGFLAKCLSSGPCLTPRRNYSTQRSCLNQNTEERS